MKVGIVGAGRIGTRRAEIVHAFPGAELAAVADVDLAKAQAAAARFGGQATSRWEEVVTRDDVEAVVISTPNHLLAPVALAAIECGKHVLVEKPMGRTPEEVYRLVEAGRSKGVRIKAGFNHRYHPAIRRAWELAHQGVVGDLLFIRARYGHGGRPHYECDWRGNPETAGGGELLDQGIHLIDLARWFLGDLEEAVGFTATSFWPIAPLEDNAFALLRSARGQVVSLHASWTQWKNLFSFEVYGRDGALTVEGLGGSYGTERLTWARRHPEFRPPEEERVEFSDPDCSWHLEWEEFVAAIRESRDPVGSGEDGLAAIQGVYAIYEAVRRGSLVRIRELFS